MKLCFLALLLTACATAQSVATAPSGAGPQPASAHGGLDTAKIEAATHLKGKLNEKEGVFKVSYARDDIKPTVAGVKMTPALGLTAWAAFTETAPGHAMVMGDIVMTEGQVNAVMSTALDNGLEVTALHNHFFGDTPKIMFMHIGGHGDTEKLAESVGKVFDVLKATATKKSDFGRGSKKPLDASKSKIDGKKLDEILATHGSNSGGIYKATFGMTTKMGGHEVGSEMGVNTWAAFAGTDKDAVVDGDFAMKENQLQGVLKALRAHDINVVAIHNHMTGDEPRIMFLHYWGTGEAAKLAEGVKAALDTQK